MAVNSSLKYFVQLFIIICGKFLCNLIGADNRLSE